MLGHYTGEEVRDILVGIISDEFELDPACFHNKNPRLKDLGVSSLDLIDELVIPIETEFDIELADRDFEGWRSFGHIVDTVSEKLGIDPPDVDEPDYPLEPTP